MEQHNHLNSQGLDLGTEGKVEEWKTIFSVFQNILKRLFVINNNHVFFA